MRRHSEHRGAHSHATPSLTGQEAAAVSRSRSDSWPASLSPVCRHVRRFADRDLNLVWNAAGPPHRPISANTARGRTSGEGDGEGQTGTADRGGAVLRARSRIPARKATGGRAQAAVGRSQTCQSIGLAASDRCPVTRNDSSSTTVTTSPISGLEFDNLRLSRWSGSRDDEPLHGKPRRKVIQIYNFVTRGCLLDH